MVNVNRALILGGLAGQVDAINALQARGVQTFACGHERKGPGVEAADEFFVADITDVDEVRALAEKLKVDLVYSVGSDIAMPTVVEVSEALGLPVFHGSALTHILRRKEELRKVLDQAGLSPVAYEHVGPQDTTRWETFPCIVKPVDAQGQRGISILTDGRELASAIELAKAASTSDDAIIEELLIGPEVSAHVLVRDGQVALVIPSDRHVWVGGLEGIPRAHSMPLSPETRSAEGEIRALVTQVVAALNVVEGPLYFQMIITESGPRIIEIASRLDGCHLWRMIRESTGYDLLDDVLGMLMGEPVQAPTELDAKPTTLRFYLDSPDVVADQTYRDATQFRDAEYVEWQLENGDVPRRTNPVVARLGYEVFQGYEL